MAVFIALLRAVNVGGTGKLPMSELRALCADAGFDNVKTYIASGNVVFTSKLSRAKVKDKLEAALKAKMGKPVAVFVRTPAQVEDIARRNPFADAAPNRVLVFFGDRAVPDKEIAGIDIPGNEQIEASGHEVFVHYPDGMGRSKLKLPFTDTATGRNLNTVNKLLALGREAEAG